MAVRRWTLGLVATLVFAQAVPGVADQLVYDRAAVLAGEWWRIVTGHFVHYSWAHLTNNLMALVPPAWLIETRYRRDGLPLLLGASAAIGIALLIGEPGIAEFRGASGVAFALLGYVGLRGLHENRRWRAVSAVFLAILAVKLAADAAGWHVQDWQQNEGFVPLILSHLVGAAVGIAAYLRHVCRTGSRGLPIASNR